MPRPAVIFATHRPPLPLDNGSRIRTHRLASGLARRLDVTLVTYADGPTYDDTFTTREELEASLPGVRVELVPYGRAHPAGLRRHLLHPSSASYGHHGRTEMRAVLERLAAAGDAVLHLDDPGAGLAGLPVRARLKTFAPHNVEHRILREIAGARPLVQRLPLEAEWRKIRAEERRLCRACDIAIGVSGLDAEAMREQGARRVAVVANGADPVSDPTPWAPPAEGEPLRVLFVGTGNYWPYTLGLAWFVEEVLPRLRRLGPVRFDVVGAPPDEPVAADDVVYHGRVPEVRPFYDAAHVLAIPVFQGSGTRLKVVEAALLDRPVVSTALGAEGLPVTGGEHYLRADRPDEFAEALHSIRTQPGRVPPMLAAARRALDGLLWPRIADGLADLYERELAQSTGTR